MITYLRMSSAWHKGDGPAPVPRSLAGDGEVAAGGQGLLDVPGHAFGPAPPPVDQHHDGGQARTVNTTHTESAFLRGWKRSPARQPGERVIGRESVGNASGPASPILTEYGRRVGSLGPGLTSESADAVRAVLRDDLSAGSQVFTAPTSGAGLTWPAS